MTSHERMEMMLQTRPLLLKSGVFSSDREVEAAFSELDLEQESEVIRDRCDLLGHQLSGTADYGYYLVQKGYDEYMCRHHHDWWVLRVDNNYDWDESTPSQKNWRPSQFSGRESPELIANIINLLQLSGERFDNCTLEKMEYVPRSKLRGWPMALFGGVKIKPVRDFRSYDGYLYALPRNPLEAGREYASRLWYLAKRIPHTGGWKYSKYDHHIWTLENHKWSQY